MHRTRASRIRAENWIQWFFGEKSWADVWFCCLWWYVTDMFIKKEFVMNGDSKEFNLTLL